MCAPVRVVVTSVVRVLPAPNVAAVIVVELVVVPPVETTANAFSPELTAPVVVQDTLAAGFDVEVPDPSEVTTIAIGYEEVTVQPGCSPVW